MRYISTRDPEKEYFYSSAEAIKKGLADDGGLFVPETIPQIDSAFITSLLPMSYAERAAEVLSLFLTDYTKEELTECCEEAYSALCFSGEAAPLKKINDKTYSLELWHGPTCAFKDIALQIMPRLLSLALNKTGEKDDALVLVATSGDTGKAALEGYKDVDRIKIKVFYPVDGVSKVQKLQMITQSGQNVGVYGIKGNFDDAQSAVKSIFSDRRIADKLGEKGYFFSSANSINWGRLVPQVVYYFSAYADLLKEKQILLGQKINFCVPTGNFGDIFAAYIAKSMGLPVGKLICASNSNNVLSDFFATGVYNRVREFKTTMSPSMDILISSNLERLLYFTAGPELTSNWMKRLKDEGSYSVDASTLSKIKSVFSGFYADEAETEEAVRNMFENNSYLIDTHTAVGFACYEKFVNKENNDFVTVVASTANPYKFAGSVYKAITFCKPNGDYESLNQLKDLTHEPIPTPLVGLNQRAIRFSRVIRPADMPNVVLEDI